MGLMLFVLCGCSTADDGGLSGPSNSGTSTTNDGISHNETPAANDDSTAPPPDTASHDADENSMPAIEITVGSDVFVARFYDNESADAIAAQMPFSLDMGDYASQEKVTQLSFDLPDATTQTPDTVKSGELYLWSGNRLVLFYTTFSNSYSYVPIGYIEDAIGLAEALGSGNVQVAFAVNDS